jgi:hypothetical protein
MSKKGKTFALLTQNIGIEVRTFGVVGQFAKPLTTKATKVHEGNA